MRIASIILALMLAIGPAREHPAGLQNADARARYDTGMKAAAAKDYAKAERELEAAYAIEPSPALLYALGQLARLGGDCTKAVQRFEAYLETKPPAPAVEDTQQLIDRCKPLVDAPPPEPTPSSVPPPEPTPERVEPPPPSLPPGPDVLGITLTTVGATLAVVGFGVFGGAFAQQARAENEPDVAAFEEGVRRARGMYWTGVGLASVGAAIAIGGVVRLLVVRHRRRVATAR